MERLHEPTIALHLYPFRTFFANYPNYNFLCVHFLRCPNFSQFLHVLIFLPVPLITGHPLFEASDSVAPVWVPSPFPAKNQIGYLISIMYTYYLRFLMANKSRPRTHERQLNFSTKLEYHSGKTDKF